MKPIKAKTSMKEVQIFQGNLGAEIYKDYAPLNMEIAVTEEPVPFAERLELTYTPIQIGEKWSDRLFDCGWLHVQGEVPPEKEGRERVLRLDVSGEGCVFDSSGTPVRGLTNMASVFDRRYGEPKKTTVFLDELEQNGGKIDVWVEIGNNDLFGTTHGGVLRLGATGYLNTELRKYYYDIDFLLNYLANIDDKNPQYYAILYALCESMAKVSSEFKDEEIAAARKILKKQLDKKNGDTFLTFSAIGHAHLDLAWLWPIRETRRKLGRTFANVVANMERYPEYKFGGSQAQQFEWLKEQYPKLFAKVKQKVDEGRFELQGGLWVESDTNATGGESLVRQVLYGKRFFKEQFGKDMRMCWLPDAFGFSGALPQILRKSGIEYFLTIKLSWSEHFEFPFHTFRWQGIDGSEVLVHMPPEGNYNSAGDPAAILFAQGNYAERGKVDTAVLLFGIGDGGGSPGRDHLERVRRAENFAGLPKVKQQFAVDAFDEMAKQKKKLSIWKGELYLDRHQGTLTSASDNKKYNRLMETALSAAEKAGVAASVLGGKSYDREQFSKIWKEVLLYQFHDILPGSSIRRVYEESVPRYKQMLEEVRESIQQSAGSIGDTLCVFNMDSFERKEVVLANGEYYEVTAKPLAFTPLTKKYAGKGAKSSENKLENKYLKAVFDSKGRVTVTDKIKGEAVVTDGNALRLYNEFLDCWDMSANFKDNFAGEMRLVSRKNYREGDAEIVEQKFAYNRSVLVQKVILKDEGRIVDFRCKIDWQETKKMLRVEFEPKYKSDVAVCDIQFGSVERPTQSATIEQFGKYEVSMQKYVDISTKDYGVAFLNDSKYAVNVKDGGVSINLLRSQMYPCVDNDKGEHEFAYAIYPHMGDRYRSDVVKRSLAYNHPLIVCNAKESEPLLHISNEDIIADTVKFAEDSGDVIVRLYESNGRYAEAEVSLNIPHTGAAEADLMENETNSCQESEGKIRLSFTPFEIKTLKIER